MRHLFLYIILYLVDTGRSSTGDGPWQVRFDFACLLDDGFPTFSVLLSSRGQSARLFQ